MKCILSKHLKLPVNFHMITLPDEERTWTIGQFTPNIGSCVECVEYI